MRKMLNRIIIFVLAIVAAFYRYAYQAEVKHCRVLGRKINALNDELYDCNVELIKFYEER